MKDSKKYVINNWKMNPISQESARTIFNGIKPTVSKLSNTISVVCPPFVYIGMLRKLYKGAKIEFGGQNCHFDDYGSKTGEVSASMLKDMGCTYVIIGHSERREMGENNSFIRQKVNNALKNDLNVVLCVGENKRTPDGEYLEFVASEIKSALSEVKEVNLSKIIIAYEPIWAIGKTENESMTPHDLHVMTLFIQKILLKMYSEKAKKIPILYGGSVGPTNAEKLIKEGNIQGFLVGGASLDPQLNSEILQIVDSY